MASLASGVVAVAAVAALGSAPGAFAADGPIAPVWFQVSRVSPDIAQLTWSQVPDGGRIEYVISGSVDKVVANPMSGSGTVSTQVSTTDTGTYSYTIRVRDEAGNMSAPKSVSFNVEHVAPTAPSSLRMVSGITDHPEVITWNRATDNSGGTLFYSVWVGNVPVATTTGTSIDINATILNILANGEDWVPTGRQPISVRATDSSQNVSAPSNAMNMII